MTYFNLPESKFNKISVFKRFQAIMDFKRYNPNYHSSEIYKYRPIFNFKPPLEDFIPLVYNFPTLHF